MSLGKRLLQNRFGCYWLGFALALTGILILVIWESCMELSELQESSTSFHSGKSSFRKLTEMASPDGTRIALVFREDIERVDRLRHVRIVRRNEIFDPNRITDSIVRDMVFDFSIWRPANLDLKWKDNNNIVIAYPVDEKLIGTYQREKALNEPVDIHYDAYSCRPK